MPPHQAHSSPHQASAQGYLTAKPTMPTATPHRTMTCAPPHRAPHTASHCIALQHHLSALSPMQIPAGHRAHTWNLSAQEAEAEEYHPKASLAIE